VFIVVLAGIDVLQVQSGITRPKELNAMTAAANLILALLAVAALAAVAGVGFRAGRPEPARVEVDKPSVEEDDRIAA
jgi:hypothetical protein